MREGGDEPIGLGKPWSGGQGGPRVADGDGVTGRGCKPAQCCAVFARAEDDEGAEPGKAQADQRVRSRSLCRPRARASSRGELQLRARTTLDLQRYFPSQVRT